MSWQRLETPRPAPRAPAAVTLAMVPGSAGRLARLRLTVRTGLVPELTWWVPRQPVDVLIGAGDEAGQMRLQPGDTRFFLRPDDETKLHVPVVLILPLLPGLQPAKHWATPAFEIGEDWLQVALPDWARPSASAPPGSMQLAPLARAWAA